MKDTQEETLVPVASLAFVFDDDLLVKTADHCKLQVKSNLLYANTMT